MLIPHFTRSHGHGHVEPQNRLTDNTMVHNDKFIQAVLTVVIAAAALNWAFVEFLDWDLLLDGIGLATGDQAYTVIVGVIGAAAVVRVYSVAEWVMEG